MSAILRILKLTGHIWRWYLGAAILILATSSLSLAFPLISKQVVDQVVAKLDGGVSDDSRVIMLLGILAALQLARVIMQGVGGWLGDQIQVKMQTFLSTRFYAHLLDLHMGYYDDEGTGKVMNRMYRGLEQITGFIQSALNNFLPFVLTAVVTIALLAFYSPVLAIALAALFPIYIFISHRSTQAWKRHQDAQNTLSDVSLARTYETIGGIRIVKSFVTEIREHGLFVGYRQAIEQITRQQSTEWHRYDFLRQLTLEVVFFGAYAYVALTTYRGGYTIGEFTLLVQLIQQAQFPLFAMSWILEQIQRAEAGSKDFFGILDTKPAIKDKPGAGRLIRRDDTAGAPLIAVDGLTFGYDAANPVLSNISFTVDNGQRVALVGKSGQGKSTLVSLLLRYYEPQSGHVSLYGQDIADVTQASLRQQIAVVFQDPHLLSGTIRENIAYANPDASDEQVIAAATAANAHDFITGLPEGYDARVGERGVKLSGGQKQRIAIARAILKAAPIVILDEATSALDTESEIHVQRGLDHLLTGRTSIIIAHRLSTIATADQIVVFSNGTVEEIGAPADLARGNGTYARLIKLQQTALSMDPEQREAALKEFDLVE